MQSLAFLWFQLQMAQQYLREEIYPPAEVRAHSANLDASTGIGTDNASEENQNRETIQINQPVTRIETTKVLADPPRQPKQKAATVIVFFLVAAGALFIGLATFGIYTRNQWTEADKRCQNLFKGKVISAQDFDTAADIYGGNQAVVRAEQANVDRLEALEAFKIIRAPFDGTVTARNTDIGAFVPAGSATPLFRMAATSRLRVYVTVPQALSSLIRVGAQAELTVDQFPGRKFPVHVVGTVGAISSDAKRLLTELEVPNPTGELSSGSYVQITLDIPIRTIAISRDPGSKPEISRGLSESDQIVGSPPPGLVDGDLVNVLK